MKSKTYSKDYTKEGYLNRMETPLPEGYCCIKIIVNNADGENVHLCEWNPNKNENGLTPTLIGTAKVILNPHKGIGFNVWSTNEYEFIYYKIIEI